MRLTAGQQHRANLASRSFRMNNNDCWGNPTQPKPTTADRLLSNPCTSYWLKDAIKSSFNRDCLDALRDAETLVQLLKERNQ